MNHLMVSAQPSCVVKCITWIFVHSVVANLKLHLCDCCCNRNMTTRVPRHVTSRPPRAFERDDADVVTSGCRVDHRDMDKCWKNLFGSAVAQARDDSYTMLYYKMFGQFDRMSVIISSHLTVSLRGRAATLRNDVHLRNGTLLIEFCI